MARGLSRLAAELNGSTAPGSNPRCWVEPGVVKAVTTGNGDPTITVTWRGVVVPCSYVASYTPTAGDVVLLLIQRPSVIALGRLVGPAT